MCSLRCVVCASHLNSMAHVLLLCNGVAFFYSIGGLTRKHRGSLQQPLRSEDVQYVELTCVRVQQPCSMKFKRLQRHAFASNARLGHDSAMTIDGQVPFPQRRARGFQALRNSALLDSCPVRKTLQAKQMQRPLHKGVSASGCNTSRSPRTRIKRKLKLGGQAIIPREAP